MTMTARDSALREAHKELVKSGTFPSCLNCEAWTEVTVCDERGEPQTYQHCALYRAVPPTEIIVWACPDWEIDIPF